MKIDPIKFKRLAIIILKAIIELLEAGFSEAQAIAQTAQKFKLPVSVVEKIFKNAK